MNSNSRSTPLTVSQLNLEAQGVLETNFRLIWLQGEVSNLSRPSSGHMYFTLKDRQSQVSAAMFRGRNQLLRFQPQAGQHVLVRAKVTLYAPRGNYQIVVEHMEQAGDGALQAQFDALKQRLFEEGLFAAERKRQLPAWPQQIGVITSASGAALRDILQVLRRRCPAVPVLLYPAAVQGQDAPAQLHQALSLAMARQECDVLIIGRGGGSLEDLWAFNDERLTRLVAACPIPIISAVGHEIDHALTDFAADMRAPTPSAAAELAGPDQQQWQQRAAAALQRIHQTMAQRLQHQQQRLEQLQSRLRSPQRLVEQDAQQLDMLVQRMHRQMALQQRQVTQRLAPLQTRLWQASPTRLLHQQTQRHDDLMHRLPRTITPLLSYRMQRLDGLGKRLNMASPLNILTRGYSITFSGEQAVRQSASVNPGDTIRTKLADGVITATVTAVDVNEATPQKAGKTPRLPPRD